MRDILSFFILAMFLSVPSLGIAEDSSRKTRKFHADLSAQNQTRLTKSPAIGSADLVLDLNSLTLSWSVEFDGLTSRPVMVGLHGPAQPGANGAVFLNLAPDGIKPKLMGFAVINEAQVQYLLAGWTYINITTEKFPFGEVRGQLDVGPRE